MTKGSSSDYTCSFCGKGRDQVSCLITGQAEVAICDECISLCHLIIEERGLATCPSDFQDLADSRTARRSGKINYPR